MDAVQPTPPPPAQTSPLLALPGELRNMIWRLIILRSEPIFVIRWRYPDRIDTISNPPISRVNAQTRREILSIFYGEHHFKIIEKDPGSVLRYDATKSIPMWRLRTGSQYLQFLRRVDIDANLAATQVSLHPQVNRHDLPPYLLTKAGEAVPFRLFRLSARMVANRLIYRLNTVSDNLGVHCCICEIVTSEENDVLEGLLKLRRSCPLDNEDEYWWKLCGECGRVKLVKDEGLKSDDLEDFQLFE